MRCWKERYGRALYILVDIEAPSPCCHDPGLRSLFTFFAAAACSGFAAHAADLTLSVAASSTNAFKDIAPLFEAANPGTKLQMNFGASGALLRDRQGRAGRCVRQRRPETMDQAQKDASEGGQAA
ncbi:MAG: hypothetical protein U1F25_09160 [Rubrivivax sp.]